MKPIRGLAITANSDCSIIPPRRVARAAFGVVKRRCACGTRNSDVVVRLKVPRALCRSCGERRMKVAVRRTVLPSIRISQARKTRFLRRLLLQSPRPSA